MIGARGEQIDDEADDLVDRQAAEVTEPAAKDDSRPRSSRRSPYPGPAIHPARHTTNATAVNIVASGNVAPSHGVKS